MFEELAADFADALKNVFIGWIPDWFWTGLAWWPWIAGALALVVAVGVLYRVYRLGGWPGLAAALGALGLIVGYVFGKRDATPPNITPKATDKKQTPAKTKIKSKHRPTLSDLDGDGIPNSKDKD